ncbi:hypothetical protein MLD38_027111 [Melastoma candidum]|uniref:Uncharacterized protein n=1 Tax=Melastoma candidum TaxID=119954 RepID=A0ACB9P3T0_9MYRT|nr:hypothetical protein MLD38_027111 [Melastoma candidum]
MVREAKGQVKVDVALDLLWRGLSKDIVTTVPKIVPNLVKKAEIVEGDGGLGSVILFEFGPGAGEVEYQKEKIVELEDSQLRLGLQVMEGGHLAAGFSFYRVTFQLTPSTDKETVVDVTIAFECEREEAASAAFISKSVGSNLAFVRALAKFLQEE